MIETAMHADAAKIWLKRSWWAIFPCFALLTIRLAIARGCGDPYDLLPVATSTPAMAWPIAGIYTLAHVWLACAYLVTAARAGTLVPPQAMWISAWGKSTRSIVLMAGAMAVEYAPIAFWISIGASAGCRPV